MTPLWAFLILHDWVGNNMTFPSFVSGEVLRAQDMNAVGMWKVIPTSVVNGTITSTGTVNISAGSASVSVNGAFTSDYNHYRIIYTLFGSSGGAFARMRLRAAGTDLIGPNYYRYGYSTVFSSGSLTVYNAAAETFFNVVGQWGGGLISTCIMDLNEPLTTNRTNWSSNTNDTGGGSNYVQNGLVDVTTAFDGFSVIPSSGTLSAGNIKIYGMKG
jgi:hypothetical protein